MNQIHIELYGISSFVKNAQVDRADEDISDADYRSRLDSAAAKLTKLRRRAEILTPPNKFEQEHDYYVKFLLQALRQVKNIDFDKDAFDEAEKRTEEYGELAKPLIDKFEGE
ncbi:hypothetical protein HGO21_12490 [Acinetobacter sp. CUI P1]|nr:hypothetical protein [Acinetobacter sp. CUI P1]